MIVEAFERKWAMFWRSSFFKLAQQKHA